MVGALSADSCSPHLSDLNSLLAAKVKTLNMADVLANAADFQFNFTSLECQAASVCDFQIDSSSPTNDAEQIHLDVAGVDLTCSGHFAYEGTAWETKLFKGSADIAANIKDAGLSFKLLKAGAMPSAVSLPAGECSLSLPADSITMTFSGHTLTADLLELFRGIVDSIIKQEAGKKACPGLENFVASEQDMAVWGFASAMAVTVPKEPSPVMETTLMTMALDAAPAGKYMGSKKVLGQTIAAAFTVTGNTIDIAISGVATIDCPKEAFTLSGDTFNIPGVSTAGDCLKDALSSNKVTLSSVNYDSASNKITVHAKYLFITVSVVLDHATDASSVAMMYELFADAAPAGKYIGSKSVLGQTVEASITIDSAAALDFALSGVATIDCPKEAYTLSGGAFAIPGTTTAGDCLNTALSSNKVTLSSVTYDATSNQITVDAKYLFLKVSVVLNSATSVNWSPVPEIISASAAVSAANTVPVLARLRRVQSEDTWTSSLTAAFAGVAPKGKYAGSKSVLGHAIDAAMVFESSTALDFTISGAFSIDCPNEAYTLSGGDLNIPGDSTKGDCLNNALSSAKVTLSSVTYDATSNEITVKAKKLFFTITVVLTHQ